VNSESKTSTPASEIESQAKNNLKKAEEMPAKLTTEDPNNALKVLDSIERNDAKNDVKRSPLKSKTDEVIAKVTFQAKENMKK
jgi:hypothetical protein